jgi:hypothetical protein
LVSVFRGNQSAICAHPCHPWSVWGSNCRNLSIRKLASISVH